MALVVYMSGLPIPLIDAFALLASLLGLGGLVGLGEMLRTGGVSSEATRRLVHVGVCGFLVVAPSIFSGPLPLYVLASLFVAANAFAEARRWWGSIHEARPDSWGTVALPLAVLPALAATWSIAPDRLFVFRGAFLILGIADPLASWVGQRDNRQVLPGATLNGSATFFGISLLLAGTALFWETEWEVGHVAAAAGVVGVVATAVEALARRGWDNFFVVVGVVLVLVPLHTGVATSASLVLGLLAGTGVWGAAARSRALSPRGAVGAGLFAATLVTLGGWDWVLPGFAFFVLSSALSWLPGGEGETMNGPQRRGPPGRTLRQVMANGGVAWGLLGIWAVLPPQGGLEGAYYAGFIGALASAAADTWATEIGIRWAGPPYSLRTFRPVAPGSSGAVSLLGSGAAVIGAATVAGAALLGGGSGPDLTGVIAAGMVGMVTDSVAGATIEAHYRDPVSGETTEQAVPHQVPLWGVRGIDNDVVNLIATAAGAAAALVFTGGMA